MIDVDQLVPERRLSGHRNRVQSVAFAPDGASLASVSGGEDVAVRVWDVPSARIRHILPGHAGRIWSVRFSPDGKRIATASGDGTIKVWDPNQRTDFTTVGLPGGTDSVAYGISLGSSSAADRASGGLALLTLTRDGRLLLHAGSGESQWSERRLFAAPVAAARFSADGKAVVCVGADSSVALADLSAHREASTIPGLRGSIRQSPQPRP